MRQTIVWIDGGGGGVFMIYRRVSKYGLSDLKG